MEQTHLTVSWNAYQKSICGGLSSLQQQGEFVDMTLAADSHPVEVHHMVMSLVSPYIKELITSADCAHPVTFLNQTSHRTLCSILEYIYTGEVLVTRENLNAFVEAGKAVHIKGLEEMSVDHTLPMNRTTTHTSHNHSAVAQCCYLIETTYLKDFKNIKIVKGRAKILIDIKNN